MKTHNTKKAEDGDVNIYLGRKAALSVVTRNGIIAGTFHENIRLED